MLPRNVPVLPAHMRIPSPDTDVHIWLVPPKYDREIHVGGDAHPARRPEDEQRAGLGWWELAGEATDLRWQEVDLAHVQEHYPATLGRVPNLGIQPPRHR
jgi:hypothetical protein